MIDTRPEWHPNDPKVYWQWGHAGMHRHGEMMHTVLAVESGEAYDSPVHGLDLNWRERAHHHHDSHCKPPPIANLFALMAGKPVESLLHDRNHSARLSR